MTKQTSASSCSGLGLADPRYPPSFVILGLEPLLSGLILWTRCTVLILLVFERLATISDTKGENTVRHHNSVFHDLLKRVPWSSFDRLVEQHGADKHVRRLSTRNQFIALLYGQLAGAVSLREIAGGLESHACRLYHIGAKPVSRSTLADAFSEYFAIDAISLTGRK